MRLKYIDMSKGLMMLFVMIGHLVFILGKNYQMIYLFHMPFFFIVSGYTQSKKTLSLPFGSFLIRLVQTLLIPIYLYRALEYSISIIIYGKGNTDISVYLTHPDIHWFLSALFFARIIFYFIYKIEQIANIYYKEWYYLMIAFLSIYGGNLLNNLGYHNRPQWFFCPIDSGLAALGFIIFGYLIKSTFNKLIIDISTLEDHKIELFIYLIAIVCTFALQCTNSFFGFFSMNFGYSDIFYYGMAILLSCAVISICKYIEDKNGIITDTLSVIGRNTLVFYPSHVLIYNLLDHYFGLKIMSEEFPLMYKFIYMGVTLTILMPICLLINRVKENEVKLWKFEFAITIVLFAITVFLLD